MGSHCMPIDIRHVMLLADLMTFKVKEIIFTMGSHCMPIDKRHVMLLADLMTFEVRE